MKISFPSVSKPNIRYSLYGRFFESPASGRGDERLTAFDTYGDGNVQHSPEWTVQGQDYPDYFLSLAKHVAENPGDVAALAEHFPHGHGRDYCRFLLSVKHKEGKAQRYSKSERKVSAADSKRYDKRWDDVPDFADGSVKSAFMLHYLDGSNCTSPVARWVTALELAHVAADDGVSFVYRDVLELAFGRWVEGLEHNAMRWTRDALKCLSESVDAYRAADNAKRQWECFTHNLGNYLSRDTAAVA